LVLLAGLFLQRETHWYPVVMVEEGWINSLAVATRALHQKTDARGKKQDVRPAPLTVVRIDDSSLTGHPWPWTPLAYSLFVQASLPFKPAVTVVEENLDWTHVDLSTSDRNKLPQYEHILRDALLRAPKVLLGERLGFPEDADAAPPLQETPILRRVTGNFHDVPEWTVIEEQPKEEFRLSANVGYVNLPDDATARSWAPLVLRYQGQMVPTLVLQAVLLQEQLSTDDVQVLLGSEVKIGAKLRIPIDARGRMRVNLAAPYTSMGFDELLLASEQIAAKQQPFAPVDKITGAITFLTRTDREARNIRLPFREPISKGELFASAVATIQTQAFLRKAPEWFPFALIGLAALAAFYIPRVRKRQVILWCAVLLVVYVVVAFLLFALHQLCLPLMLPAGLLLFIALYRAGTPNYVWRLREPVIF
jgi:hypothetical protein